MDNDTMQFSLTGIEKLKGAGKGLQELLIQEWLKMVEGRIRESIKSDEEGND